MRSPRRPLRLGPRGSGAADDGAAVATVLEIARILAARPAPRHPVVLLLTDGEERDCWARRCSFAITHSPSG